MKDLSVGSWKIKVLKLFPSVALLHKRDGKNPLQRRRRRRRREPSVHPAQPHCSAATGHVVWVRDITAIINAYTPAAEWWSVSSCLQTYVRLPLSDINKFTPTLRGPLKGILGNVGNHWLKGDADVKVGTPSWWQKHCTSLIDDITASERRVVP